MASGVFFMTIAVSIGMFLPQVLGMGYAWLQIAMNGNFVLLPIILIPIIIVAKIVGTSLTIGSGGSGGVFAPALVIGWLARSSTLDISRWTFAKFRSCHCCICYCGDDGVFRGRGQSACCCHTDG